MSNASVPTNVRNPEEALVYGQAFQRVAEQLIQAIWKLEEGLHHVVQDEMGDVVVCATNLAFALELYLKGLLALLGLDVPKVHDLHDLFSALPQSVRSVIEDTYNIAIPDDLRRMGGRASFSVAKGPLGTPPEWEKLKALLALPDLLVRSRDLFQSWRYLFEFREPKDGSYRFHQFDYGFLRCAAEVLRVELMVRLDQSGERPLPTRPTSGKC